MLILAFDTSGFSGSVALLDGPRLMAEIALEADRKSAQTLAPAIVRLLAEQQVEPGQVELVATTIGPGSFTGLRVGVTAAKTFAYAIGAQVLGISTLEALAHGIPDSLLTGPARQIHAVLDAQRNELFVGRFRSDTRDGSPTFARLEPDQLFAAEPWKNSLAPGTIVTGPGLKRVAGTLPQGVIAADEKLWNAQAGIVGRLAWRDFQAGRRDDIWKLAPAYLRPSYAEEKAKLTSPQTASTPRPNSPRSKTP